MRRSTLTNANSTCVSTLAPTLAPHVFVLTSKSIELHPATACGIACWQECVNGGEPCATFKRPNRENRSCSISKIRTTAGRGRLFDSILDTVGDTPAIRINNLGPDHATIYVKAEFFNPAASVKDRLALNIIEEAERSGALKPGQTVVEATSGNTGIGLAMVCAQKGYPLVVTMADSFSIERRKLMRMLGAKVVLTPRAQKGFGMYKKAVELAEANGWFLARQFETAANAAIHEATTAREIINDFAGSRLDYFVTGYGTGGTVVGVGARVAPGAAGDADRSQRTGQRPADRQRQGAGTRRRRRACRQPSGLRTAPDPGLDAGFHSQRAAGGDRRQLL